jgi:HTH-type transcriptional regulator, sugar sensing transcriptional regulator
MLKELQDMGLSEKEARVYLAALELGRTTAEKLATAAKVNRSTTYVQLESLMKMGLMSTYEEGKKTYFAPESPTYLKRILELKRGEISAREKELDKLLPDLNHLFDGAGEKPLVRFFMGKEGVANMREQILDAKNKNIQVIYSFDALANTFTEHEREEYSKRRSKKGIVARIIYNKKDGPFPEDFEYTSRCHIPENVFKVTNDIVIFDNKVAVANLQGALFGVLIENAQIADSMRSIFEFIWKAAPKFNNKK